MNKQYPTVKILGSRIHKISIPDVTQLMKDWIGDYRKGDVCRQIIVTGFHGIWEAYRSEAVKNALNSADIWIPDGIAPIFIARLKGQRNMRRIPGAELMRAFFEKADQKHYRSFFYGDTEKTLAGLRQRLAIDYPGHCIAGTFSPPFRPLTEKEETAAIAMINASRPDVLWVSLGLPKQELWIHRNIDRLKVPLAIGVGAAFGFISGKVKRVPEWIGNNGLEWFWRFIQEPRKLWRRDLIDGPRFLWHVFLELARERRKRQEDQKVRN